MRLFIFTIFLLALMGCSSHLTEEIEESEINHSSREESIGKPSDSENDNLEAPEELKLGNLCSGIEQCTSFCKNNRGRCEAYCKEQNQSCQQFYYVEPKNPEQDSTQKNLQPEGKLSDEPPILKNLGIILDKPNMANKRAGELLFDKRVVWEDGGSYSDKAFGDFGELGKRKDITNKPGVEYNFAVPIGTKVHAAGDGIVAIFPIDHTKDFGINIQSREGSSWFIGHEHLVNLAIKDKQVVKAGDVLGEATPNSRGYATTQLAVWTGGREIVKYCPFLFLEDNLEREYEEKINNLAAEWEKFIGKDVYEQEKWVSPGCLLEKIVESG